MSVHGVGVGEVTGLGAVGDAHADPLGSPTRHTEPLDVHMIAVREGAQGPEVLLSRRAGAVYAAGMWHLPSGHLDGPHEDVVTAVVRETREETGLVVDPADVRAAVTVHQRAPSGRARVGFFFELRRWQGVPRVMEPEVCDGMDWFPLDALPEPIIAYCRAGLDAYRAGTRIAVHFQEPGDPVAYDPAYARARRVPGAGTTDRPPEEEVRAFAERAVGAITEWADVSWRRENSRVWRVRGSAGGTWFVKVHQNARFHGREVAAYRGWVPSLGDAGPRLVAVGEALRAVVLTAVPGRSLHGAVLPRDQERAVFRSVGELTARIHGSRLAAPGDPDGLQHALSNLERHLQAARTHLEAGDEEFIRSVAERAALLPPLERVATHGDLQLRNLLLDDDGTVRVIDFERSEPGPTVRDFARLLDAVDGRADLRQALFAGYGRALTDVEEAHLAAESVLDAVSGIGFGIAVGDPEVVERGRRTLAAFRRSTAATPPSSPVRDH